MYPVTGQSLTRGYDTCHFKVEDGLRKSEVERTAKAEIRKVNFLTEGQAAKAIF